MHAHEADSTLNWFSQYHHQIDLVIILLAMGYFLYRYRKEMIYPVIEYLKK